MVPSLFFVASVIAFQGSTPLHARVVSTDYSGGKLTMVANVDIVNPPQKVSPISKKNGLVEVRAAIESPDGRVRWSQTLDEFTLGGPDSVKAGLKTYTFSRRLPTGTYYAVIQVVDPYVPSRYHSEIERGRGNIPRKIDAMLVAEEALRVEVSPKPGSPSPQPQPRTTKGQRIAGPNARISLDRPAPQPGTLNVSGAISVQDAQGPPENFPDAIGYEAVITIREARRENGRVVPGVLLVEEKVAEFRDVVGKGDTTKGIDKTYKLPAGHYLTRITIFVSTRQRQAKPGSPEVKAHELIHTQIPMWVE